MSVRSRHSLKISKQQVCVCVCVCVCVLLQLTIEHTTVAAGMCEGSQELSGVPFCGNRTTEYLYENQTNEQAVQQEQPRLFSVRCSCAANSKL